MRYRLILVAALLGCSARPPTQQAQVVPMSCGGACSSSTECQGIGSCNYCYFGRCTGTLPARPFPDVDAGVDASQK